jgi:hypothetical protein
MGEATTKRGAVRNGWADAFFGANSSRPTGSFRQRQKTQKVYTMCSAQSVYHVPVLTLSGGLSQVGEKRLLNAGGSQDWLNIMVNLLAALH